MSGCGRFDAIGTTDARVACSFVFNWPFLNCRSQRKLSHEKFINLCNLLNFLIRRVAKILKRKGGGFFERVRKLQTTLTQIFIVLESESHGLSDFGRFILEIETDFLAKFENSNAFSAQIQVISKKKKKKGLHRN